MGDSRSKARILGFAGVVVAAFGVWLTLRAAGRAARGERAGERRSGSNEVARLSEPGALLSGERSALEFAPGAPEVASSEPAQPTSSPAAPVARLRVSGRVVDELQAPIEGAEVFGRVSFGEFLVFARSDASGAFAGEIARDHYLNFTVFAPGHARAEIRFLAEMRNDLELGTIVLAPGGAVLGRVFEEGGRVPAGGEVALVEVDALPAGGGRALFSEANELWGDLDSPLHAELAPDGTFELPGVPIGEHLLVARTPGGMAWTPPIRVEAGATLEHELLVPRADESHWIEGRVLDARGEPLEGVALGLDDSGVRIDNVQTAPDGRFSFQLTEPGVFLLLASDPRQRSADLEFAGVRSGQRALELVLEPVPMVEVRLRDERGASIAWGNVWSIGGDSHVPLTPLGEHGVGRFPFVGREVRLEADAPGFARTRFGPYGREIVATGLELVLVPGGFVRGRVTSSGRAVKGARLDFSWAREPGELRLARGTAPDGWPFVVANHVNVSGQDGTSDGDGRFVLSIPSAGWHALRVEAEGFPLIVFGPWELDPARAGPELALELAPGGTLEGRVLLPAGESPLGRFVGASNGWSFAHTTAVDAEGRYRFANLAPGEWQVRPVLPPVASLQAFEVDWSAAGFEREPDVVVRSGASARFDLDLVTPRGCALAGHFRFEGVELADWSVILGISGMRGSSSVARSSLGRDGAFRVVAPRPGPYELYIWSEGRRFMREVQLSGVETTLELSFAPAKLAVDSDSEQGRSLRIEGTCVDGTRFEAWSWRKKGSQTWRVDVPAGNFRVGSDGSWNPPLDLAPGEERVLTLPPASG
jgi:hypothetical protein